MELDILAFGAHPDDVELACSGTVLKHIASGKKVGIMDLTRGELGTRGTPEIREREANEAAKILGVSIRENLGFADGFFVNDKTHQLAVINKIRKYRPAIVLANALSDRHPDHGRAAQLVATASFLAGLVSIETTENGQLQQPWRPKAVYHYIQYYFPRTDIAVDISDFMEKKMEAVKAYKSQFHDPASKEPPTLISTPAFLQSLYDRAAELGRMVGVQYAEGFTTERLTGVSSLFDLL